MAAAASFANTRPRPFDNAVITPRNVAASWAENAARPSMTRRFWLIDLNFSGG